MNQPWYLMGGRGDEKERMALLDLLREIYLTGRFACYSDPLCGKCLYCRLFQTLKAAGKLPNAD